MPYVDGFVLPVPKKKLAAYRRLALAASKIWRDHGALEFRECAGDDLNLGMGVPFTKMAKTKPGETVVFSWIVYKSRADRDRINKKVMKDPRMAKMAKPAAMPFDVKRMAMGGLSTASGRAFRPASPSPSPSAAARQTHNIAGGRGHHPHPHGRRRHESSGRTPVIRHPGSSNSCGHSCGPRTPAPLMGRRHFLGAFPGSARLHPCISPRFHVTQRAAPNPAGLRNFVLLLPVSRPGYLKRTK